MKTIHLNIGANIDGIERLTLAEVERACARVGLPTYESRTVQSTTEKTYALACDGEDQPIHVIKLSLKRLSALLQQDCIACILGDKGFLVGEKRNEWGGKFLPAHWISVK